MIPMTLLFVLRAVAELIALLALGAAIIKKPVPMRKLFFFGPILGVFVFALRELPLKFGLHSILAIMAMIVIFHFFCGFKVKSSAVGAFGSLFILAVIEWFCMVYLWGKPVEQFLELSQMEQLINGLPALLILVALAAAGQYWASGRAKKEAEGLNGG